MTTRSRTLTTFLHIGSMLVGSLVTLAVVTLASSGKAVCTTAGEVAANCPNHVRSAAPELPRDWVWKRSAIEFDSMFKG